MRKCYNLRKQLLLIGFILIGFTNSAQDIPFDCDYSAYLFQFNDVYAIDLASGSSFQVATDVTPGDINAAAYNPADGYIWGSLSSPAKTIVRIGKNFTTTTYYIEELPSNNRYVGDVNAQGVYFLKGGGTTYYKIDLDPNSANYTQHLATETLSQNINIHDWAFNAVDGNLYAVAKNSNILYRIDPSNGNVEAIGEVPILNGLDYTYGAVYFDVTGRFYVSANQTGTIYVIQSVQDLNASSTIDSNLFAFGPSSSSNDGARCPTAPVPQEICDNGIDDDGDGLIDCEDPSCSGFGLCDVIEPPVSGGNNGGLESNNRLSDKINQRNYSRAKINYEFDRSNARRVKKSPVYGQRNSNFQLQNFIPLSVIGEDYVVESTPTDLLGITNATEVYSVDYIKNEDPIASILALKTENGVYEHTKYICDRLLGAELISVSTIDINEQSFIKSIIRNNDGSIEFVLSLSAKVVNNDENFSIESHWNLDRYESNVTFYNFQIWSNSLDDLLLLGQEVLHLLNIEKPISEYNNSTPPAVFVRKGKYFNGQLELQIVNNNASEEVTLDAGLRETETSSVTYVNSSINLNSEYIKDLELETGNIFDIGLRISDGVSTPDDIFMSDGPWGYDDSPQSTNINSYAILPNESPFGTDEFPVERNVSLEASTSEYVSVYRALTPRFNAIDLSDYRSFKLNAKGTGNLLITFVKKSISNWEEQYKTTIELTNDLQEFEIPFSEFNSTSGSNLVLDDIVTVVFTMISENGELVIKEMTLEHVRFSIDDVTLSVETFMVSDLNKLIAAPNPMGSSSTILFDATESEEMVLQLYNKLGSLVYQTNLISIIGKNQITLNRQNLSAGLYFCKIINSQNSYETLKLLVK